MNNPQTHEEWAPQTDWDEDDVDKEQTATEFPSAPKIESTGQKLSDIMKQKMREWEFEGFSSSFSGIQHSKFSGFHPVACVLSKAAKSLHAESKENLMDIRPRCAQCGQQFPHETALHQHHIDTHDAYLQQVIGTGQDIPGITKAVHDVLGGTLTGTGTRLNPGPYNALLASKRLSYPPALFDECDAVPQRNISVQTRDEALLPAWKLPARSTIRKCDSQINFVAERMFERCMLCSCVCSVHYRHVIVIFNCPPFDISVLG